MNVIYFKGVIETVLNTENMNFLSHVVITKE